MTTWPIWTIPSVEKLFTFFSFVISRYIHFGAYIINSMGKRTLYLYKHILWDYYIISVSTFLIQFPKLTNFCLVFHSKIDVYWLFLSCFIRIIIVFCYIRIFRSYGTWFLIEIGQTLIFVNIKFIRGVKLCVIFIYFIGLTVNVRIINIIVPELVTSFLSLKLDEFKSKKLFFSFLLFVFFDFPSFWDDSKCWVSLKSVILSRKMCSELLKWRSFL